MPLTPSPTPYRSRGDKSPIRVTVTYCDEPMNLRGLYPLLEGALADMARAAERQEVFNAELRKYQKAAGERKTVVVNGKKSLAEPM